MSEDPRYLRNQSREAHRLYRQNRTMLRWSVILWTLAVTAFTGAAILDLISGLGWGYETTDVWGGLLMLVFGGAFWLFASLVNRIVLGISRRLYGPDPGGPVES